MPPNVAAVMTARHTTAASTIVKRYLKTHAKDRVPANQKSVRQVGARIVPISLLELTILVLLISKPIQTDQPRKELRDTRMLMAQSIAYQF